MTSSSVEAEEALLRAGQLIRDRWRIKCKLGGGGFGEIYEANDMQYKMEPVAVKVEAATANKQVLKMEVAVLRRLQGRKHACKFYGCGRNEKFNYLVMSLQGRNLADLRREAPRQCFSLSTAIRLALQILKAIEDIHVIGFLHRDIKPSNFAIGRTSDTMRTVYMLDYGLARQYVNDRNEIRLPRPVAGFRGTVRYASVTAHKNKEMGRHDDLWSLFYMLIEFLHGSLPWRKIKDKDEVGRIKESMSIDRLIIGLPDELKEFAVILSKIGYYDEPDYDLLSRCLRKVLNRLNIKIDDPYDWELNYANLTKLRPPSAANSRKSATLALREQHTLESREATQAPTAADCVNDFENDGQQGSGKKKLDTLKLKFKKAEFMKLRPGSVDLEVIETVNQRLAAVSNGDGYGQPDGQQYTTRARRGQSADARREQYATNRSQTSCESNNGIATVRSEDAIAPKWSQELVRPLRQLPKSTSAVVGYFQAQNAQPSLTSNMAPLAPNDWDFDQGRTNGPHSSTRPTCSIRSSRAVSRHEME